MDLLMDTFSTQYYTDTAILHGEQKTNRKSTTGIAWQSRSAGMRGNLKPLQQEGLDAFTGDEFMAASDFDAEYFLRQVSRNWKPEIKNLKFSRVGEKLMDDSQHEQYIIPGDNLIAKWTALIMAAGLVMTFAMFLIIPVWFFTGLDSIYSWQDWLGSFAVIAACYAVYRLFGWITYFLPFNHYVSLNRRTGMVEFVDNKKKISVPFSEYDFYIGYHTQANGGMEHFLFAVHRYSNSILELGGTTIGDVYLRAAYFRQFMDAGLALPDIPDLERFRERDPTTVELDKQANRNPRYWRDMPLDKLDAIIKDKRAKVKSVLGDDCFRF